MKEIKFHPLSELFPLMPNAEIKDLVADIKLRGLQSPIVLYEGKILDGRHRYEACQQNGIKPKFEQYKGKDAIGFVVSANLKRRHLTTLERSLIAAKFANLPRGGDRKSEGYEQSANLRQTHEQAAKTLRVSERSVDTASKILDAGPRVLKQIEDGIKAGEIKSLRAAEKEVDAIQSKDEPVVDETGFPIPSGCVQFWTRKGEVQELMTAVSRVKSKLEAARAEDDVLFRNVSQAVVNELSLAYSFLANAKPYAVCLHCQGKTKDNCRSCKGTGLMARFAYEHEQIKGLRTMREAVMAKGKK